MCMWPHALAGGVGAEQLTFLCPCPGYPRHDLVSGGDNIVNSNVQVGNGCAEHGSERPDRLGTRGGVRSRYGSGNMLDPFGHVVPSSLGKESTVRCIRLTGVAVIGATTASIVTRDSATAFLRSRTMRAASRDGPEPSVARSRCIGVMDVYPFLKLHGMAGRKTGVLGQPSCCVLTHALTTRAQVGAREHPASSRGGYRAWRLRTRFPGRRCRRASR